MIVLLHGLPLFSQRLAEDLKELDPKNHYIALNTYYNKLELLKFLILIPFCKIVISQNGVFEKSRGLDWVIFWKKKLILNWMGTDVLNAVASKNNSSFYSKYVEYATNFSDCIWLREELKSISVVTQYVQFKYVEQIGKNQSPKDLRVYTYIDELRPEFYGLSHFIKLALQHPLISFTIIGKKPTKDHPKNVTFLGWVSSDVVNKVTKESSVYIRLTEHDGNSKTILEALSNGLEVIWTMPGDCCHHVKNISDLSTIFKSVISEIKLRKFTLNENNRNFVFTNYNKTKIIENFIARINE